MEFYIYKYSYNLAQIYSKYGLSESFFFFEKLNLLSHYEEMVVVLHNYNVYIRFIVFFYQFLVFLFICMLVFFNLVEYLQIENINYIFQNIFVRPSYFLTGVRDHQNLYKETVIEEVYGWYYGLGNNIFEKRMLHLMNVFWVELWGIF